MNKNIKICSLGGYGEIGKNMTIIEYKNSIIIIDCGISFPDNEHPGIDYIIPNIEYLENKKKKIKGIFITHGHEDHIGALPYIIEKLNYPKIYCKNLAKELIEEKLIDKGIKYNKFKKVTKRNNKVKAGSIRVEFINVNHSIMDSSALYIMAGNKSIFFTGDFKIDYTPIKEDFINLNRISEIGQQNIDLMIVDSTNVTHEGLSYSEKQVGIEMNEIISNIENRVIIATFSTNLSRLVQIFNIAKKNDRKVVVLGRSLKRIIKIAYKLGYIDLKNYEIINKNEVDNYKDDQLLYLITGSQGEKLSALKRASKDNNRDLELKRNDTILISAKVIPGNEVAINRMVNDLYRKVDEVYYENVSEIHVSGHASKEDIKIITKLLNPKYIVPNHGEYKHIKKMKKLMIHLGYGEEKIKLVENGDLLLLEDNNLKLEKDVIKSGEILIENREMGFIDINKLFERKIMGESGLIFIILYLSDKRNTIPREPEFIIKGIQFDDRFINEMKEKVKSVVNVLENEELYEDELFKKRIRRRLKRYIRKRKYKDPFVIIKIME